MLGPLLFVYKDFLVTFFVLQKKSITEKKVFFPKKIIPTERIIEKCVNQKDEQEHSGRRKKFRQKKSKRCGIHIEKIDPKAFLSISYFEKCFYMQSLPTANVTLV